MTKVAVVTGSNRGIGFGIVRGLCKQFSGDVVITARQEQQGREAVAKLEEEGLKPLFHQLDINDSKSVENLRDFLKEKYGGLDILVNNAGIAFKNASTAPFSEQAEVTMQTNFYALLNVCDTLFPVLNPGARVVHVSSYASKMAFSKCSDAMQAIVRQAKTIDDVKKIMADFVDAAKADRHAAEGFPNTAYGMTKLGVTTAAPIQQKLISGDASRPDIVINACCPGYVDTDMTSHKGTKTIDQGADTPLYLALLPPGTTSPRGDFVRERNISNFF